MSGCHYCGVTGEVERVLAYLDDLEDDAAVHIWPDDLEMCQRSECVVKVYSVRMGSPDGKTVPLFSRDQVAEAVRAALSHKEQECTCLSTGPDYCLRHAS